MLLNWSMSLSLKSDISGQQGAMESSCAKLIFKVTLHVKCIFSLRTFSTTSTSAPDSIRVSTTVTWPFPAAICKGDCFSYTINYVIINVACTYITTFASGFWKIILLLHEQYYVHITTYFIILHEIRYSNYLKYLRNIPEMP